MCHGKRGAIHQAYRDGVADQLGSLSLVLSTIVLWTTRYVDAAVARLPGRPRPRPLSHADALELDEDDEGAD